MDTLIQGFKMVRIYDVATDADLFMLTLKQNILPITILNGYPGDRSVLVLDNAAIHKKPLIIEACILSPSLFVWLQSDRGRLPFGKAQLRRDFKVEDANHPLAEQLKKKALRYCCDADKACNLFQHCFFKVTAQDRRWAKGLWLTLLPLHEVPILLLSIMHLPLLMRSRAEFYRSTHCIDLFHIYVHRQW